jgi:hypothetical protein
MKSIRTLALAGLALGLAGSALAQQTPPAKGIPGYLNPKTHTFSARVRPSAAPDATTVKTYTGTLKFEYTIKLDTPVASGQALYCEAAADVEDTTGDEFYEEEAASTAKVSGTTATCTVNIPYSWGLADESADTIGLSYDLVIFPTSTTTLDYYYAVREHTSGLPALKVPTSGATTVIPVAATI